MSAFNNKFNKDDLTERNIIAAVLHQLSDRISFSYFHSEDKEEKVTVPFYYSISGDERFLMDEFLNEFDSKTAETNYDKVPRGVIYVDSSGIRTDARTNPHVRLEEIKEIKEDPNDEVGELKTFYSLFTSIPISLSFNVQIKVDSHRDLLIISELLKKRFFRNVRFYYDYKGFRVPGNIQFPENLDRQNPIEYTFSDSKDKEITLSLDVISFLPDYNENSSIFAGNRIGDFDASLLLKNNLNK